MEVNVGIVFPLHNVRIYTFRGKKTDNISRAHLHGNVYSDHIYSMLIQINVKHKA